MRYLGMGFKREERWAGKMEGERSGLKKKKKKGGAASAACGRLFPYLLQLFNAPHGVRHGDEAAERSHRW
jgi:hypothetical protein